MPDYSQLNILAECPCLFIHFSENSHDKFEPLGGEWICPNLKFGRASWMPLSLFSIIRSKHRRARLCVAIKFYWLFFFLLIKSAEMCASVCCETFWRTRNSHWCAVAFIVRYFKSTGKDCTRHNMVKAHQTDFRVPARVSCVTNTENSNMNLNTSWCVLTISVDTNIEQCEHVLRTFPRWPAARIGWSLALSLPTHSSLMTCFICCSRYQWSYQNPAFFASRPAITAETHRHWRVTEYDPSCEAAIWNQIWVLLNDSHLPFLVRKFIRTSRNVIVRQSAEMLR